MSQPHERGARETVLGSDVLIVEDDDTIREQLAEALEYEGFSVVTASNGREALDRLSRGPVRTMIMDLMMPVMNGWELVQSIRAHASLASIPILTITAVSNAHRAPGGPLFLKPLNIGSLVRAVRTYIGRA